MLTPTVDDHKSLLKAGIVGAIALLLAKAPWMLRVVLFHFPPPSWTCGVVVAVVVCMIVLPLTSAAAAEQRGLTLRANVQGVAWGWRAKQRAERKSHLAVLRLQHQLRAQAEELAETRRLLRLQKVETNQAMAQLPQATGK